MAFGKQVGAALAENDVSMNRLHLETRFSTSYLSKLMRDEFLPGEQNMQKVLEGLRVLDVPDETIAQLSVEHKGNLRERELWKEIKEALNTIDDPEERWRAITDLSREVDRALELQAADRCSE